MRVRAASSVLVVVVKGVRENAACNMSAGVLTQKGLELTIHM
jgi:hypothetical protein